MRGTRGGVLLAGIVALAVTLSACAPDRDNTVPVPMPVPTSSGSPTPNPAAEPDPDPTLLPGGSALANRAYFDFVNKRLLAVNKNPSDQAVVTNLEKSGFAKKDLEVTPDKTSVFRAPSASIEFSVRVGDTCLIGQFKSGAYRSVIGPVVDGRCLVGKTAPIP
ncbi:hypothetical protein BKA04_000604 [Cryobacterium mesophilum]|uniref:DUF6993 domain-containing protein n=1 Tax=Terrimesophilobacter mesophilus TaxID=433647 RepID=A0A4R8V8Q4_9MICO|nr:hypothetical protein [Terrimesophilobacter mesophilus]MBB5632381.1 hypothetical protein [Terrimesophilobacter mesophilus]TFB79219.1 hypothetical protein E3N84_03600 [Terrimesophilobacter mesophilus]